MSNITVSQEVIDTVCNSLRASKQSLRSQLYKVESGTSKEEILMRQYAEVEEALRVFQNLES